MHKPVLSALIVATGLALVACRGESPDLTALCAAVESRDVDQVRALLDKTPRDLNADQGTTGVRCRPFEMAISQVEPERLTKDQRPLDIVRLMFDRGADANSCWSIDRSGSSRVRRSSGSESRPVCVIEYAAGTQSDAFVRLAIERGAKVTGGAGAAALGAAAAAGELAIAKTLLAAGAPINEVTSSPDPGRTETPALGMAVANFQMEMVAFLEAQPGAREFAPPGALSGAASAAARVVQGQGGLTAREQTFMTAARRGDVVVIKAHLADGVQVNRLDDLGLSALMRAAAWGRTPAVEALLQAGADVNLMNAAKTALHLAAEFGHVDVIRTLVRAKANINARAEGPPNETPLFAAVRAGQTAAVRALIDSGADTTVSESSKTVLEYAVWRANAAVVRELLTGGRTAVNGRDPSSTESPLHGALWCKNRDYNVELITVLLQAGADRAAKDQNGDTPLQAVERKRAKETLPYYQTCYDAQLAVLKGASR